MTNKILPAMRGSTLGVNVIRIPRPLAALLRRVSLVVSAKPRANVRWSWGRKGFTASGIFSNSLLSVKKIAPSRSI